MGVDRSGSNFLREDLVEREGEDLVEREGEDLVEREGEDLVEREGEEDNDGVIWGGAGRAAMEGESSWLELLGEKLSVFWIGVLLRGLCIIGMSLPVYDGWVIIYDNLIDESYLFKLSTSLLSSDLNIE